MRNLGLIIVNGCIDTIDAMGCQTEISAKIIEREADYILAVKDRQQSLHKELQELLCLKRSESFET
jgi:predicted transposase YbfD/YdcC